MLNYIWTTWYGRKGSDEPRYVILINNLMSSVSVIFIGKNNGLALRSLSYLINSECLNACGREQERTVMFPRTTIKWIVQILIIQCTYVRMHFRHKFWTGWKTEKKTSKNTPTFFFLVLSVNKIEKAIKKSLAIESQTSLLRTKNETIFCKLFASRKTKSSQHLFSENSLSLT